MLSLHELFHLRQANEVGLFTEVMPFMVTPLFIGYREYRDIHMHHHAYMATPMDPDYFHIRGKPWQGLLNAFTAPEQIFFRWVSQQKTDIRFIFGVFIRLLLFASLMLITGWHFLWYWVPVRLAHGISYFTFFYCLHRRNGLYGVYSLPLPQSARQLLGVIFGRDAVQATCHHDVHHAHPGITADHLAHYQQRP